MLQLHPSGHHDVGRHFDLLAIIDEGPRVADGTHKRSMTGTVHSPQLGCRKFIRLGMRREAVVESCEKGRPTFEVTLSEDCCCWVRLGSLAEDRPNRQAGLGQDYIPRYARGSTEHLLTQCMNTVFVHSWQNATFSNCGRPTALETTNIVVGYRVGWVHVGVGSRPTFINSSATEGA